MIWVGPLILTAVAFPGGVEDSALGAGFQASGDTVVVVSGSEPDPIRIESANVVWRSDALGNPTAMAWVGDHIVIGDRDRIHVVASNGEHRSTFGRSGEGPGEFGVVSAVSPFGTDAIAVFDGRLRRVSMFSLDGELLRSWRATAGFSFVNPVTRGFRLVRVGTGVLSVMTENVRGDRATRRALLLHDLEEDSAEVLETWDHLQYEPVGGGILGSREMFAQRVIVALGGDGRFAKGDPHEYCIRLTRFGDEDVRTVCRERDAVPVGRRIRSPDFGLLDHEAPLTERLIEFLRAQRVGEYLPHFDQLLYSEHGDLWVRILDSTMADVHPGILAERPDVGPTQRWWEVLSSDGRLVAKVALPAALAPQVILEDRIFGFLTLETGEVTVGRVDLEDPGIRR